MSVPLNNPPRPDATSPQSGAASPRRLWAMLGPDGREASRDLVVMCLLMGTAQVAALVSLWLVTSTISVAQFGLLATALSLQQFAAIFTHGGLRHPLIRDLTQHPERKDALCTAYGLMTFVAGVAVFAITVCILAVLDLSRNETLVWLFIAGGNIAVASHPLPIFDAFGKQVTGTFFQSLSEVLALVAFIWLATTDRLTVVSAAFVFGLKWYVSQLLSVVWLWLVMRAFRVRVARHEMAMLYRSGVWLSGSAFCQTIVASGGPAITRFLAGSTAAGLFGIAQQAFRAHTMIMTLVSRLIAPRMAARGHDSGFVRRCLTAVTSFSFAVATAGAVSGVAVILFALSEQYHAAVVALLILMAAAAIRGAATASNVVLIARGKESAVTTVAAVTLGLFLLGVAVTAFVCDQQGPEFASTFATALAASSLIAAIAMAVTSSVLCRATTTADSEPSATVTTQNSSE